MSEKVMFGKRGRLVPALAALACAGALAATAACSSDASDDSASGGETTTSAASGSSAADAELGDCAEPTVEVLDLETYDDAEPVVQLPVPEGWERNTMMDSQMIRATIGLPDQMDEETGGVPVVNVVIEDVSHIADGGAEGIIEAEVAGVEQVGGTVTDRTSTEICGLPSERAEAVAALMGDEESELAFQVMVYEAGDAAYAVVLTAQAPDPQNPEYRAGVETIFDEIQILPSGGNL